MTRDEANEWAVLLATASTATDFASIAPTTTEPTGAGIVDLKGTPGTTFRNLKVIPFGTDAADEAFDIRIVGWQKVSTLWVPSILFQGTCTLSSAVGVAAAAVLNTEFFADTITLTTNFGNSNVDVSIVSPANNTPAHIMVDLKGHRKVGIYFDRNTAATCNCLYKGL